MFGTGDGYIDQPSAQTGRKVQASALSSAVLSGGSAVTLVGPLADLSAFLLEKFAPSWSDPSVITVLELLIIGPIVGLVAFAGTWAAGYFTRSRKGEIC
jgi:hypothetical protein